VSVGGEQPGPTGRAATTSVVEGRFRVTGKAVVIRGTESESRRQRGE
jgi:hypothetical protein